MFHSPWYLLMLLIVPLLAWRLFVSWRRGAVRFRSLQTVHQMTPSARQRLSWLPSALTLGAIVFMILGAARPREGREQTTVDSEGTAIESVVDCSDSMQAMDFNIDRKPVDRLTAVKKVASE